MAAQLATLLFIRHALVDTLHILLLRAGTVVTAGKHLDNFRRFECFFLVVTSACSNTCRRNENGKTGSERIFF
jgi:hypothetical protein